MQTGRDTLHVLDEHIEKTQSELAATDRQLAILTQEMAAQDRELGEAYRRLARIRLNDLMAERVIFDFDEKDRATLALLEKRQSALKEFDTRLAESLSTQKHLEAEREAIGKNRDAAGREFQERMEKSLGRVYASEAFTAQRQRLAQAEEVARLTEEKARQAALDRKEKGAPYESDRLFMYLWNRGYLTAEYSGRWISRSLDGWVGGLIDFSRNRANYHLLLEIPARLGEHAQNAKQNAEQEAKALSDIEAAALAADGLPGFRAQAEAGEKRLAAHDAAIEAEAARYRGLIEERNRFNDLTDPLAAEALSLQEKGLKSEPMKALFSDALKTVGPQDDAAVARIQELQGEIDLKKSETRTLQALQRQRQQSLLEMETLRRRYRQEGYDAYHTTFPSDFSIGTLLGDLISGALNSEAVWREIGRHRRGRPASGPIRVPSGGPESPWGGQWPSNPGSGGARNKGGFRTGGQF